MGRPLLAVEVGSPLRVEPVGPLVLLLIFNIFILTRILMLSLTLHATSRNTNANADTKSNTNLHETTIATVATFCSSDAQVWKGPVKMGFEAT